MATLYNITERYQNVLELYGDENVNQELVEAALSQLDGELNDKVANGLGVIRELKLRAEALDTEIKRLQRLKKAAENGVERLQKYYLDALMELGVKKVMTPRGTMTVANNGGKLPLVIDDEDQIPLDFKKSVVTTLLDKDSVRIALERGIKVEGAHLGERGRYLKIS